MKYTLRAGLAVALLLGVYVLALAIVAGLAAGLYEIVVHGFSGAGVVKLFLLAVVIAIAIGRGLWAGLRLPDGEPEGVELGEQAQPRLWAEVRGLAERLGTRPPEEIRLVPEVNAAVSESSRWMGLVPGTRRMYVGVPLLTGLSEQQMRSVLAHELGHYSGRHTALARVTYRGQESLVRVIQHVGPGSVVGKVFALYARLYFAVAGAVNRRQELEADTFSAVVAGKATAMRALEELAPISAAWSFFLENYVRACCGEAHRPRAVFAGFHELWSAPERQRQLDEVRHDPPTPQRSVYDTHPSTAERVARISVLDAPDLPDDSGPAIGLLDDAPAALLRLEDWMFDGSDLEPVAWDEALAVALSGSARRNAALLVSAVEQGGEAQTDLGGVLQALRNGWVRELVAPVMPPGATDEEHQQAAGQLVGDLVATALLDTGVGAYRLDWSRAASLVDASGAPLDPWRLAHDAAHSRDAVPALETWCDAHGVPRTFRIEPAGPAPVRPSGSEPRLLAAALLATEWRCRYVFVLDDGLVVKKPTLREKLTGALGQTLGTGPGAAMLGRWVGRASVPEIVAARHSTFLPWAAIARAELRERSRGRVRLALHLADGTSHVVKGGAGSHAEGDVWGALGHHLGDRLLRGN